MYILIFKVFVPVLFSRFSSDEKIVAFAMKYPLRSGAGGGCVSLVFQGSFYVHGDQF
jgi:hypothetical protein